MGSCSIMSLARVITGKQDFNYQIIGQKPGEKTYEELITNTESERTVSLGNWFVILPDDTTIVSSKISDSINKRYSMYDRINKPLVSYNELLSNDQLSNMLLQAKLV